MDAVADVPNDGPGAPPHVIAVWQGGTASAHPGEHAALRQAVVDGRLAGVDLVYTSPVSAGGYDAIDGGRLLREVEELVNDRSASVLYLQHFHGRNLPDVRPLVQRLRIRRDPLVVVTSCGDPLGAPGNPVPEPLRWAAAVSDLVLVTSMGRLAAKLRRYGAPRVTLVPLATDALRLPDVVPGAIEDDVVFVGSRVGRNPFRRHRWVARRRHQMVEALQRRFGSRFALYGLGWEGAAAWRGPVPYDQQLEVMARGAVVVGGYPGSLEPFYMSDRPFTALRSGRPLVDHRVDGVGSILEDGRDWVLTGDTESMVSAVEALLSDPGRSGRLATDGAQAVRDRHLVGHRVDLRLRMIAEILRARAERRAPRCPELSYLRPAAAPAGLSLGW